MKLVSTERVQGGDPAVMPYDEILISDSKRAVWCYLIGVTVAAVLGSIVTLIAAFPLVWLVGAIIGLPALLVILVLLAVCQRSIHANLKTWSIVVPLLVVLIGAALAGDIALPIFLFIGAATSACVFYEQTKIAELRPEGAVT